MTSDAIRTRHGLAAGALACALALAAAACADFSRGEPSPKKDAGTSAADGGGGEGGATTSFATSVYPLLTAQCQRCRTRFPTTGAGTLCPVCAYRRANPFSSRLPADI